MSCRGISSSALSFDKVVARIESDPKLNLGGNVQRNSIRTLILIFSLFYVHRFPAKQAQGGALPQSPSLKFQSRNLPSRP